MRDLHASLPRPAAEGDLSARIRQAAHLTGEFLLRSGETATQFLDEYRFAADPALLDAAARAMVPLIPPNTEVLAGLELGGVPVATALSLHTGLPIAFIRKKAKIHGTCRLAEGADITGKHVLIIDAVVNTGGQIALSAADLRPLGATITHALCVIDRGRTGRTNLAAHGVELLNLLELT
ncbi:orotate phosphoribosyltransferase [Nocardia sp. NBC_01327]|uniref:orotate phosphoribosyltransferase n=1 Tax=Nocardia sp. NBC_01327 TaxID=2903593 RepID=UPI002E103DCD|nr:phosphoribosyltransferase family protein [Nocardia sp. NBC_01327]